MMRDDDEDDDEDDEMMEEVLRPPAYNEQRFRSKIEKDIGYEIPNESLKEELAEDVYNPQPEAEFGFDPSVPGATRGNGPLVVTAVYTANTGGFDTDDGDAAVKPTNLVAASKGYVMPQDMAEETNKDVDSTIDSKFGAAAQEAANHEPGLQLDTVDEGGDSDNEEKAPRGAPSSTKGRIRVAVRFRPMTDAEMVSKSWRKTQEGDPDAFVGWDSSDDGKLDVLTQRGVRSKVEGKNMFHLDRIYEEHDEIDTIYSDICEPIVTDVVSGRHGTVFGYGATGGGKSHTMQGGKQISGIIQLAAKDVFRKISQDSAREYTVKASYFEIYNEQVRDLMGVDEEDNPKSRRATAVLTTVNKMNSDLPILNIREDSKGGDVFVNAITTNVMSVENIIRVLYKGNRNRATEKTKSNKFSSRSHAIFRLTIESHELMDDDEIDLTEGVKSRVSALNFVDLAGSENAAKASTTGLRKREGGKINQSLLSLSQVIHQLSLPKKKQPGHINFRDSKLTRLLQPHLSGNAAIAILCCASPAKLCVEDTRQTLKFAYNAKRIKLKPKVNEIVDDKVLIEGLKKELHDTRMKYEELKQFVKDNPPGSGPSDSEFPMLDAFMSRMSASVRTVDFLDAVEDEVSAMSAGVGGNSSRRASGNAFAAAPAIQEHEATPNDNTNPAADGDDEDDVEAFRRQILAKFMEEALEESENDGDDYDDSAENMNETDSTMQRTYAGEESMMTGFVTETDDDNSDDIPRKRELPTPEEVFRKSDSEKEVASTGGLPLIHSAVEKEPEPKRTFLGDDDSSNTQQEMPEYDDLDLIEKFRSEILEKFRDEIVDDEGAEELDENAQNVAVIANELISKFKKEIVYKYKNEFPEIQVKRVEVDLSAARVGDNGIVGRVIDSNSDAQLNSTDDSSRSGSSGGGEVEQFEDEFDEEMKMGDGSKPQHRTSNFKRANSSQTDGAVVNGHGQGENGKVVLRTETDPSTLPLRSSLGGGASGSVSSDLSSDVVDRDKGSSKSSPKPANPPGDDEDYIIPPGEIAIGKGLGVDGKVQIKFLEEKLVATDELVETLFVELENAKTFIRELVFENAGGGGNGIDRSAGAALFGAGGTSGVTVLDEQILNQCEILKFGIYTSLLFFVFGQHELFLATVFFLWLSLEVATKT